MTFPNSTQRRASVDRIRIPWIIDVLAAIDALREIKADKTVTSQWSELYTAKQVVETIFGESLYLLCRAVRK